QPRLFNLNDSNRAICKKDVERPLQDLLDEVLHAESHGEPLDVDYLSKSAARIIVDKVSSILGSKSSTHRKAKYLPNDVCRTQALISTICKANDLIRTLLKR